MSASDTFESGATSSALQWEEAARRAASAGPGSPAYRSMQHAAGGGFLRFGTGCVLC